MQINSYLQQIPRVSQVARICAGSGGKGLIPEAGRYQVRKLTGLKAEAEVEANVLGESSKGSSMQKTNISH